MTAERKVVRCAIYTRKSSDDGLDQEFNSLDAQREACEAYVKSQASEGWRALLDRYDDGGFSGGSMERPALKLLLADIVLGKIDVIICYKLDRLSRSLADFVRMVELFDEHEVSFVSITQQFNTSTSMGRLTLNMLLSFAQFEREVTSERIRDKIAASKAKGMWMGGTLPLGYDLPKDKSRILEVNEEEAATVRLIFEKYLEIGSVYALARWLNEHGYRTKLRPYGGGSSRGGAQFGGGVLYSLLRSQLYLGMIVHKGKVYQGGHKAIVEPTLFDAVQAKLTASRAKRRGTADRQASAPLVGRIFDASGQAMSPTLSYGKHGKRYRYYVSAALQKGGSAQAGDELVQRISADALHDRLIELIARIIPDRAGDPLSLPSRIEVHRTSIHLTLPRRICAGMQARLSPAETIEDDHVSPDDLRLIAAIRLRNRRGKTEVSSATVTKPRRDPFLVNALQRAHAMVPLDSQRQPILLAAPPSQYARRLASLAFLAPDLQRAIMEGTQPANLRIDDLLAQPLPIDWAEQRELFRMHAY